MIDGIYYNLDRYTIYKLRPTHNVAKPDKNGKYHYVYVRINLLNSAFYIGKKTSKILYDENYDSYGCKHLQRAFNKYGKHNFCCFVVAYCNSADECSFLEWLLITPEMVKSKECYNAKGGGDGWGAFGTHPATVAAENGTYWASGNNNPIYKVTAEGRNIFSTDNNPALVAKREGRKLNDGSKVRQLVLNGNFHMLAKPAWDNPKQTELSNNVWRNADLIFAELEQFPEYKSKLMRRWFIEKYSIDLSIYSLNHLLKMKSNGWNPIKDSRWISYKNKEKINEK